MDTHASTRDMLASRGLRCTAQRERIYQSLRATTSHPTAEELYQMVKPRSARLSRATVYNALEAFCEVGLVQKLATTQGCSRYDADTTPHMHIRMRPSGVIRDVPGHLGDRLLGNVPRDVINEIERELNVRIDQVTIQLFGVPRDA